MNVPVRAYLRMGGAFHAGLLIEGNAWSTPWGCIARSLKPG
jgi:hypothetical protein